MEKRVSILKPYVENDVVVAVGTVAVFAADVVVAVDGCVGYVVVVAALYFRGHLRQPLRSRLHIRHKKVGDILASF